MDYSTRRRGRPPRTVRLGTVLLVALLATLTLAPDQPTRPSRRLSGR